MSFLARLRPELVHVAPPWRTFGATVTGLVDSLVSAGTLDAEVRDDAVRAVMTREDESSTALLDIGVGVPHARLAGLRQAVVALAVSRAGLYEPVPTVPVATVALVLSPPSATADHLRILTDIATLLRSRELRAALLAAPDADAALAALGTHARAIPSR